MVLPGRGSRTTLIFSGMKAKTWHDRIINAYDRGKFTPKDKEDAEHWTTCAAWELLHIRYPDKHISEITSIIDNDSYLTYLGCFFGQVVYEDDVSRAHIYYSNMKRHIAKM